MQLLPDDIDFSAFMHETDAGHKVRKASDYKADVISYFHDRKANNHAHAPWEKTKGKIGFRKGEVTLWGGMNGHGKSLVLGQLVTGFARQEQKTVIASMEMKPAVTIARMVRQEYGIPSIDAIDQFHAWTDPFIYLYDQMGAVKTETMLAVLRYCASELKANHFVIDSLMKCGLSEDDYTAQKHFIDQLCSIARDTDMHIHLVAHSKKKSDEFSAPGKYDLKGSGSITDQADNVITVFRNKKKEQDAERGVATSDPDCWLICDKQRNGEWEGRIGLWLNKIRFAFTESEGF